MNFLLVPLHTDKINNVAYSDNTTFYVYAAFFNVLLTYGMETAFFRFFSGKKDKNRIVSTAITSLTITALTFFVFTWLFKQTLAEWVQLELFYFKCLLIVLVFDTLVVVPFAYLRATNKSISFAAYKTTNTLVYVLLNFLFLWAIPNFSWQLSFYQPNDLVQYIFIANVAGSGITLLLFLPYFFRVQYSIHLSTLKQLWQYGWPIMIAGIAFVVNEMADKLFLKYMLNESLMGAYAACYKLGVFMTLFVQAFKLGAEPFFFNRSTHPNAKSNYAMIMKYFVILGAIGLLFVVFYIDFFKDLLIRNSSYWEALSIVPLILIANLCLGIYHNLSVWYKLTNKTRYGMYISIFGASITIAFNWIMIPVIGFMASAWATLAAYGTMMLISYQLGKKYYPVPYAIKRISGYLVLSIVFSLVSFYWLRNLFYSEKVLLYGLNTLLLFVFLAIVFYLERKELSSILKS